jgi:hypothetical protein
LAVGAPELINADVYLRRFHQGLQQLGWNVGRNVRIEYGWGAGDPERIRKSITELIDLAPDVILAGGSATLAPLLQATRAVPIVFVHVPDPVGAGLSTAWGGQAAMPPVLPSSKRHQWKMAGAAQAGSASRDASGGRSGSRY